MRKKLPAIAAMFFVVALGLGSGAVLENQSRTNFAALTQLANLKTFTFDRADSNSYVLEEFVSDSHKEPSFDFVPTVSLVFFQFVILLLAVIIWWIIAKDKANYEDKGTERDSDSAV